MKKIAKLLPVLVICFLIGKWSSTPQLPTDAVNAPLAAPTVTSVPTPWAAQNMDAAAHGEADAASGTLFPVKMSAGAASAGASSDQYAITRSIGASSQSAATRSAGGQSIGKTAEPEIGAPQTPSASPDTGFSGANPTHAEARIEQDGLEVKRGQRDDVVASMQRLLIHYGYLSAGSADGIFGQNTERAIEEFQAQNNLYVTGVINGETYDALYYGVIRDGEAAGSAVRRKAAATPSPPPSKTPKPTVTPKPTKTPKPTPTQRPVAYDEEDQEELVWIPRTGKRYHDNQYCSNMKNPKQVTISEAKRRGFTPCKKCY